MLAFWWNTFPLSPQKVMFLSFLRPCSLMRTLSMTTFVNTNVVILSVLMIFWKPEKRSKSLDLTYSSAGLWMILPEVTCIRSTHQEVFLGKGVLFLGKGVLKTCSKFTGEQPCWSAISIKFQSNFIEIALRRGCSPVNLLHIFRTSFLQNTFGGLLRCMKVLAYFGRTY